MNAERSEAGMLSPVKRALVEIRQLKERVAQLESGLREPIAIIGLGLRFPGGVVDATSFEQLLWSGTDAVTAIPPERWSLDDFYAADPDEPGRMTTRFGALLGGSGPLRRGVLRHLAARGGDDGSAAAAAAGGGLGGARGRRPVRRARSRARAPASTWASPTATTGGRCSSGPGSDRHLLQHRQRLERRRRPRVLPARAAGPRHVGGHGVLFVAGGGAPGLSGAASGRMRHGAGRRRQRDPARPR